VPLKRALNLEKTRKKSRIVLKQSLTYCRWKRSKSCRRRWNASCWWNERTEYFYSSI